MIDFFKKLFGARPAPVESNAPYKIETPPAESTPVAQGEIKVDTSSAAPKPPAKKSTPNNGGRSRKPQAGATPAAPVAKKPRKKS